MAALLKPVAVSKGSHVPISGFAYHSFKISTEPNESPDQTPLATPDNMIGTIMGIFPFSSLTESRKPHARRNANGRNQKLSRELFDTNGYPDGKHWAMPKNAIRATPFSIYSFVFLSILIL
jgi:hypothetical protein